ncbi:chorismate mutase [Streptomyces sp. NPDC091972]|uniref:chorismate mutase n=1 Tax=Streptomyces sp. NPDC091972 TaxID=3366007 RepID=UPI00381AFB78
MRNSTPFAVTLTAAAALLVVPGSAAAAPTPTAGRTALYPVADLAAERLTTADLVAAAKWGTDSPIDDPTREQQVLDDVAARAELLGADTSENRGTLACRPELALAALQVRHEDHLDGLHTRALVRALPSICRD